MDITYLGHSSFKLKGKTTTVVTDPYDEKCGKFPKDVEADIVTVSHDHGDHNRADLVKSPEFIVKGPGEYEIKGVSVVGMPTWHDDKNGAERGPNTVYIIEMDGLRIAHLGDVGHKLAQEQLDEMGAVDVLLVPVGGKFTIGPAAAGEVVRQVDPWVVIPMHYRQEGLDQKLFEGLAEVGDFLKEMGATSVMPAAKLSISRDRLPQEMQVVVLERKE